jgi:competence protein ComEA
MRRCWLVRTNTARWLTLLIALMLVGYASAARTPVKRRALRTPRGTHLVDINRASAEELKTLPGIADALAASIKRNRPYQNKAQLLSRKVIPEATYARIKTRIIARQIR